MARDSAFSASIDSTIMQVPHPIPLMEISVRPLISPVPRLQVYADAQAELKCVEQVHTRIMETK